MTGAERRSEILDQVRQCVCRDRQNTYGDAEDNFATIAKLWNTWIATWYVACPGPRLDARDVAMMSALIKVARAGTSPDHLDNWIDLAGYAVCGGGIVKAASDTPAQEHWKNFSDEAWRKFDKTLEKFVEMPSESNQESVSTMRCPFIAVDPTRQCTLGAGHAGEHVYAP